MKKAGIRLLIPRRIYPLSTIDSATVKTNRGKSMNFDPQIVAQANAFVNALRSGKRARVPALKLKHWQQFMTVVYAGLGLA